MILSKKRILPAVVVVALLYAAPFFSPQYVLALLITMLMYSTAAVSWMILSSYTGYINLGAAGSFGLGAYVTTILWPDLPFGAIIVAGCLAGACLALIIGTPALRVRGPYFVILTFGLSQLLLQAFTLYEAKVVKQVGAILLYPPTDLVLYLALATMGVLAVLTAHFVKHSRFGVGLLSIKGDEEAAEAMGVNTTLYKLVAYAISSGLLGGVGAIMALRWTYIDPPIAFNPLISFQVAIMSILGGTRGFIGPILGAVALTAISEAFGVRFPYHYLIILGCILIVMVKYLPDGLLGAFSAIWDKRRRQPQNQRVGQVPAVADVMGGDGANP